LFSVIGFLPHVTECLTDSSWFVKKAAIDLISKIVSSIVSNTTATTACSDVLSDVEEKMLTAVFAPVITDKDCDISQLSICLEVLENRELLVRILVLLRVDRRQIVKRLCTVVKLLPTSFSCYDVTRILDVLASASQSSDYWNEAKQQLLSLVTVLMNDGKILLAVTVAAWLLQRFVVA